MKGLAGKIVVITGAGQGIGEAIAMRFAAEGSFVVAAHRNEAKGERLVSRLREAGGRGTFVRTDVTVEADIERLVEITSRERGQIDVLCNNAGVGLLRSVVESSQEDYNHVMDVNVRGVFFACKHVLPGMLDRGTGAVVNIASVASFVGFRRDAAYCASKGAVLMLTRQLALDYAREGIRVNAVCPGFIDTPELRHYVDQQADRAAALAEVVSLHPVGRIGLPREVAATAAFLASDEASFMTGSALVVDGGLLVQ